MGRDAARGDPVVIEERRPVPLEHHHGVGVELHLMHVERTAELMPNPSSCPWTVRRSATRRTTAGARGPRNTTGPRAPARGIGASTYRGEEVVETLAQHGMLPAIYFVFSRAGLRPGVEWLMGSGIRHLAGRGRAGSETSPRCARLDGRGRPAELGFYAFGEALAAGISAHHAGMLPVFKETVEELFEAGLVKIVFATETLSLASTCPPDPS